MISTLIDIIYSYKMWLLTKYLIFFLYVCRLHVMKASGQVQCSETHIRLVMGMKREHRWIAWRKIYSRVRVVGGKAIVYWKWYGCIYFIAICFRWSLYGCCLLRMFGALTRIFQSFVFVCNLKSNFRRYSHQQMWT